MPTAVLSIVGVDDCETCPDGGSPAPATIDLTWDEEDGWFAGAVEVCGETYNLRWYCADNSENSFDMKLEITTTDCFEIGGPFEVFRDPGSVCDCWEYNIPIGTCCGPAGGNLFFTIGNDC